MSRRALAALAGLLALALGLAASAAAGGGAAPGQLRVAPAAGYTPRALHGALDDYRCFLVDPHLARDVFVTSADVRPGRPSIVHHVILFEATGALAAAAERRDRASGGRGWTCFGGLGLGAAEVQTPRGVDGPQWLGAWVPGHLARRLPAGLGVLLPRGAKIVLQVHYNLMHGARRDRTTAVLETVPAAGAHLRAVDTMLFTAPIELPCPVGTSGPLCDRATALADLRRKYGPYGTLVPRGLLLLCGKTAAAVAAAGGVTSCDRRLDSRLTIYGVGGHMHLRGRDIRLELDPGTPRARTLLHIPRWSFHWQDVYYLQHPIEAGPGDVVRVTCRFDASADTSSMLGGMRLPPRYVLWGEGTTDEMCLGVLEVARVAA